MKLYLIRSGILNARQHFFVEGAGNEVRYVPMPFYLIQHRGKNILFDVGNPKFIIKGVDVPELDYGMHMSEGEFAPHALRKLGVEPEDVDLILLSHKHPDHAGALGEFPNATIVVRRKEYDFPTKSMKIPKGLNWYCIEHDEPYDVCGDGKLILYFTPGHTVGHQSLMVNTDKSGTIMLTADACYVHENMEMDIPPASDDPNFNADQYRQNLAWFRELEKAGAKVIAGHDDKTWEKCLHAPSYYE